MANKWLSFLHYVTGHHSLFGLQLKTWPRDFDSNSFKSPRHRTANASTQWQFTVQYGMANGGWPAECFFGLQGIGRGPGLLRHLV